jgi:hypothetical protein
MKFSPHSLSKTLKSFRRLLLRRLLPKISAIAPVTHLDRLIYRRNFQKSRKSFKRLLLRLFVPVSPLGANSYKKIGGVGWRGVGVPTIWVGRGLPSLPSAIEGAAPKALSTCVPYHLREFIKMSQKSPSVFYHLQTLFPLSTCVPYHLQKRRGWGYTTPRSFGRGGAK